jgi:perosamine synthetase
MVPVNEPLLNGNEKKYLIQCIETGWISSEGPFVKQLEEKFSGLVNRQHGIAVCNGSAALDAAVAAIGVGIGDEVIMPAFTIISCAAAVVRAGGIPVLVDSLPDTWNMDVQSIEKKITPRTKAIMIVHIYGLPVDVDPVLELARKYNVRVIEDAAEMHGQTYRGRPCGSFGDISTFSFYPNKHITTGEGGMIVTNDPDLAEKCRSLRNLCFDKERRYIHQDLGWNLRMSNVQAALGVAQMERINLVVQKKRSIGRKYTELLSGIKGLHLPLQEDKFAVNIYWVFGIVLGPEISFDATEAMKQLGQRGIGTRHFFWPMHLQPVFKKRGLFQDVSLPVSENLSQRGFYIPSGIALTDGQITEVAKAIKEVFS